MNKKLSIIITHHNESEHIIAPLLTSINNQIGVDFKDIEILIVNNCNNPKIEFNISNWHNLRDCTKFLYPTIKNKLGCSRQFAVDNANGEWAIFLDCDDKLYSDYTIHDILNITLSNADLYHCKELHETFDDSHNFVEKIEEVNYVFLHGKIFKTQLLKTLPFNKEELSDHEDIYSCLYLNGHNIKEEVSDKIIYVWKNNAESVTRRDNKIHDFLGLPDLIRCYYFIYSDLLKEGIDIQNLKEDILEFIKWKYVWIKINSLQSDIFELEGLFALFIDTFDPDLQCLTYQNEVYGESYEQFVHRIVNAYRNKIYPEWNVDTLINKYYKVWDINIKTYREYLRLSLHYYYTKDYVNSLHYAKLALSLNEKSYKSNILIALSEHALQNKELSITYSKTAMEIYEKNLYDPDWEDDCCMADSDVFDALALQSYYLKNYDISYYWGKVACSKNYLKDPRIYANFEYYKSALNINSKCAWITLLTDNKYINGEIALVRSLQEVNTQYPIYCVVTDEVAQENIEVLDKIGVNLIKVDKIIPDNFNEYSVDNWNKATDLYCHGWHNALTKLKIFDLTQFDTIVYIDNDTVVYENMDELFTKPHMSAVHDYYGTKPLFCSGLMVIHPNHDLYKSIMNFLTLFSDKLPTEQEMKDKNYSEIYICGMIHDQLVLQNYFRNWENEPEKHLPIWYHTWTTYFSNDGRNNGDIPKVKSMHFIDAKPWVAGKKYYYQFQKKGYVEYVRHSLNYINYIEETIGILRSKGINSSFFGIPE